MTQAQRNRKTPTWNKHRGTIYECNDTKLRTASMSDRSRIYGKHDSYWFGRIRAADRSGDRELRQEISHVSVEQSTRLMDLERMGLHKICSVRDDDGIDR